MTRTPTLSELRKEARRVFGSKATVFVNLYDEVVIWPSTDNSDEGDYTISGPHARHFAMAGLRSLPSRGGKKGAGRG